jgi:hypothetical protein
LNKNYSNHDPQTETPRLVSDVPIAPEKTAEVGWVLEQVYQDLSKTGAAITAPV